MMDYSEKRDFIRMPIQCQAMIRSQHTEEPAALRDLSASGVRFISTQAFDAGQRLQLTVAPPGSITPPLEAEIAVLRCRELEEGFDIAASIELVAPALYPEDN